MIIAQRMFLRLLILLLHAMMITVKTMKTKETPVVPLSDDISCTYYCSIRGDSPEDDGRNFEDFVPENEK
jgi:hypothetical protein